MNAVMKFEAGPLTLVVTFDVRDEFGLKRFERRLAKVDTVGQLLVMIAKYEKDAETKALWHCENEDAIHFDSTRDVFAWWSKQVTLGREVHKRKRKAA